MAAGGLEECFANCTDLWAPPSEKVHEEVGLKVGGEDCEDCGDGGALLFRRGAVKEVFDGGYDDHDGDDGKSLV